MISPDKTGFSAAQDRLREKLGVEVVFHVTIPPTYAPGTKLDPQTGRPMDPWAVPTASGTVDVPLMASLIARPLARLLQDESMNTPIGEVNSDTAALRLASGAMSQIKDAKTCTLLGRRFLVTDLREDVAAGAHRRVIAFLKRG